MNIIVTGATSLIGHFLLPHLRSAGHSVHAFSRSKQADKSNEWHLYDGSLLKATPSVNAATVLIHLGPLKVLPNMLDEFIELGGTRVIAFSSTSRYSKLQSGEEKERQLAEELIAAEEELALKCEIKNISWTIFRPTLIYGAGLDKNVSSITRFVKKFGFFPLVGAGSGLRQPVHADDLANACVAVLSNEKSFDKAYDLVGGETLTYKEMVERLFVTLNKKPRFFQFPLSIFRFAMRCASVLPIYSHVTPDMADRMNQPLCFSCDAAKEDFGYVNRGFSPQRADLEQQLSYARL